MPKLSLSSISNLSGNPASAQTAINAAFAALEGAFDNTLSRDGSTPNSMEASLDMNSNRIINLASPVDPNDAARYVDIVGAEYLDVAVPAQSGNDDKFLKTTGSVLAWDFPEAYYSRTTAEQSAGVTPTDYSYEPGNVLRYGADPTGVASSTTAIQSAINTGHDVLFPTGSYKAGLLTQSADSQRFLALGEVKIIKNANGALFTGTGANVELNGIGFRGDASSPIFTGDGVVVSGNSPRLINCGARWFSGRAVKLTGSNVSIIGSCDVYQTTDATGSGYDIEIGLSGVATLYHRVWGITSTQATGGILFTDCGSQVVESCQFGKLNVAAGTSPSGVNGGNYLGNRILGDSTVSISGSTFAGNTIGTATLTFGAGTSGHSFDGSNVLASGATLTDNSTSSYVVDIRQVPPLAYTPAWTAASVNPALGDGTLTALASKVGRTVTVQLRLVAGSTTTFGTGVWYFTVPYIPSTTLPAVGSVHATDTGTTNYVGVCETLTDGTARMQVYFNAANAAGSAVPFTWASGDILSATITYFV